jgi:hypothetical protein
MTGPNGAGVKFDKMLRSELLRKDDDVLKTLRKLAPTIAKTVDDIDMKFADILARLQRIDGGGAFAFTVADHAAPRAEWRGGAGVDGSHEPGGPLGAFEQTETIGGFNWPTTPATGEPVRRRRSIRARA